jgi:hypothetical protein
MRTLIQFFLLALISTASGAPAAEESAETLFVRANESFQKGVNSSGPEAAAGITEAASLYEAIIREKRIRNGFIYYNLGNCYFHLGQIGKAIVNYRRAENLIPNYSDLKRNLKSARAQRLDNIQKDQIRSISRTLFFWHFLMSLHAKVIAFSVLFSLVWLLLLVRLFLDKPMLKWGVSLLLLFSLVFGGSAAIDVYRARSLRFGVIVRESTAPRKGPGESYSFSFKEGLHEGTEFRLMDQQDTWLQIALENGALCWVDSRDVELL